MRKMIGIITHCKIKEGLADCIRAAEMSKSVGKK